MKKISKPVKVVGDTLNWYLSLGDNAKERVRTVQLMPEMHEEAVKAFEKRGVPTALYLDHDPEKGAFGYITKLEANKGGEDGLWAIEYEVNEAGEALLESGKYPYPSGDFILHKNGDEVLWYELSGVSFVASPGSDNVERFAASDKGTVLLQKVEEHQIKEANMPTQNIDELVLALQDEEVVKLLPLEAVKMLIKLRPDAVEASTVEPAAPPADPAQPAPPAQPVKEKEEEEEEIKIEETEKAAMSDLKKTVEDMAYSSGGNYVNSSLEEAMKSIKGFARAFPGNVDKCAALAYKIVKFYGGQEVEKAYMSAKAYKEKTANDITAKDLDTAFFKENRFGQ